jgi:hypothetical protein
MDEINTGEYKILMSLPFDIDNYHKVFNKYPKCLMESGGHVYGMWYIGWLYKRKIGYYGEFPPSYLKRVHALFPKQERILHLFAGTIEDYPGATTVDINPDLKPTIVDDVLNISKHIPRGTKNIVIADPPYSKKDAIRYKTPLVNKKLVFREARKVVEEGAIMVWLDTGVPIFRKVEWNLIGMIGVYCGTNRVARFSSIFQASTDECYDKFMEEEKEKKKKKKI